MILFVDDEIRDMESFVQELKFEFGKEAVKFIQNVDEALEYLEENKSKIQLLLLDNMMPSGKIFKDKPTKQGLRTGIFFYKYIRQQYPDLPVIIFTNVPESNAFTDFSDESEEKIRNLLTKDKDKKKALYLHKADFFPYELVEEVKNLLRI